MKTMKKKTKPQFSDSFAEMYKPPFVEHNREMCKDLHKKIHSELNENYKIKVPGRKKSD